MIRINLLPARRGLREVRRQLWLAAALVIVTLGGIGWFYTVQGDTISRKQRTLRALEAELERLEPIVKEVQAFEARKALLVQKIEVIGNLHRGQQRPARMLDAISQLLPDQAWLTVIIENSGSVSITGKSFDDVGVAAFMENLGHSPLFVSVGLVELRSEALQGQQVKAFTVTARLKQAVPKDDIS